MKEAHVTIAVGLYDELMDSKRNHAALVSEMADLREALRMNKVRTFVRKISLAERLKVLWTGDISKIIVVTYDRS